MKTAPETINAAAELWAKGHSAAEIARALGFVSKSAVNQMAHRNRSLFPERSLAFRGVHGRAAARGEAGDWCEADIDKAANAWRDGKSSSEIARLVGRSRSAVVGVMHRNRARFPLRGITGGAAVKKVAPKVEKNVRPSSRLTALGASAVSVERPPSGLAFQHRGKPVFGSRPTPFMALAAGQCRWPLVDLLDASGADMPCCGAPVVRLSYCGPHANRAAGAGTYSERDADRALLLYGRA